MWAGTAAWWMGSAFASAIWSSDWTYLACEDFHLESSRVVLWGSLATNRQAMIRRVRTTVPVWSLLHCASL